MIDWIRKKMSERRMARLRANRDAYIAGYNEADQDRKKFSSVSFTTYGGPISPFDMGYRDRLMGKFEPPEVE